MKLYDFPKFLKLSLLYKLNGLRFRYSAKMIPGVPSFFVKPAHEYGEWMRVGSSFDDAERYLSDYLAKPIGEDDTI
jgi:hypothetical protein